MFHDRIIPGTICRPVQDRLHKRASEGLHTKNVEWVLHYHPPRRLAEFIQESGRAGRKSWNYIVIAWCCIVLIELPEIEVGIKVIRPWKYHTNQFHHHNKYSVQGCLVNRIKPHSRLVIQKNTLARFDQKAIWTGCQIVSVIQSGTVRSCHLFLYAQSTRDYVLTGKPCVLLWRTTSNHLQPQMLMASSATDRRRFTRVRGLFDCALVNGWVLVNSCTDGYLGSR